MSEVICMGILVADLVGGPLKEYPLTGKLVTVNNMGIYNGGCAANTSIALSRLGIKTGVIGRIGFDGLGDFLLRVLNNEGLNIAGITRSITCNTSATMVVLDEEGERSFIHYIGTNGEFGIEHIDFNLFKKTKIVHIAGSFLMPKFDGSETAETLKKLKDMRIITCLDTAWDCNDKWLSSIEECLPYIDYFIPSIDEAKKISAKETPEDIAEFFLSYNINTVVLKMGGQGSFAMDAKEQVYMPAFKINVKDTTGAGDAFAGGFLAGIAKELGIRESLTLGNAAGALCVAEFGASTGLKSWDETRKFIEKNAV